MTELKKDAQVLAQFAFSFKPADIAYRFVIRVFDDGTWEASEVEGEGNYLVQQGVWRVRPEENVRFHTNPREKP